MSKITLQPSSTTLFKWILTDTEHGIVCEFDEGNFNGSQKITLLEDPSAKDSAQALASYVREMADWLREHHYELVFTSPQRIKNTARATIGMQLKQAREAKGFTTRHLGKLTGIAYNHISRIEQGRYNANIDTIAIIANALGLQLTIS